MEGTLDVEGSVFSAAWLKPKKNKSKPKTTKTDAHTTFKGLCRFGAHFFVGVSGVLQKMQPRFCNFRVPFTRALPPVHPLTKTLRNRDHE
jgi:hypothetical protein